MTPRHASSNAAYAGPVVNPAIASAAVSASGRFQPPAGVPAGVRRVTAAHSPSRGSGSSTGTSEPRQSRTPAARKERQRYAHGVRSPPSRAGTHGMSEVQWVG